MIDGDYSPEFINENELQGFLAKNNIIREIDAFQRQLKELFFVN